MYGTAFLFAISVQLAVDLCTHAQVFGQMTLLEVLRKFFFSVRISSTPGIPTVLYCILSPTLRIPFRFTGKAGNITRIWITGYPYVETRKG
jgi:hypothetical protein